MTQLRSHLRNFCFNERFKLISSCVPKSVAITRHTWFFGRSGVRVKSTSWSLRHRVAPMKLRGSTTLSGCSLGALFLGFISPWLKQLAAWIPWCVENWDYLTRDWIFDVFPIFLEEWNSEILFKKRHASFESFKENDSGLWMKILVKKPQIWSCLVFQPSVFGSGQNNSSTRVQLSLWLMNAFTPCETHQLVGLDYRFQLVEPIKAAADRKSVV